MHPDLLAGILKLMYDCFDMNKFSDRLKLQKYIYFLQVFGLNIGYNFRLYLYGPYSTQLTQDGFQIEKYSELNPVEFDDPAAKEKLINFKNFISPNCNDDEWLEIASSIHILAKLDGKNKEKVIGFIKSKHPYFNNPQTELKIKEIWDELERARLI